MDDDGDDPFAGLSDEREIKRAYARLIKQHRPDRDPEGFARIHAAFERAMGRAPDVEPTPPNDLLPRLDAMLEERRYDEVVALLRDPALRARADEDVGVAVPALRAIAALAWRSGDAATLLHAYFTVPRELGIERLIDRVEHELELAARWRRALGPGSLHTGPLRPAHAEDFPAALISLIADATLSSPRRRAAALDDLARLLRDPVRLLRACDRIAVADTTLAALLVARFHAETPGGARTLDRLPRDRFDALGQALVELERTLHAPVRPWMIAAGAVGGVAAAVTAVIPLAVGAGVALGSAGIGSLQVGLARRRYLQRVRPGLAAIVARLGVQADAVRAWLSYNRRLAGDLATYDISVSSDRGLALVGALGALARETHAARLELALAD